MKWVEGDSDAEQLNYAIAQQRAIVSFNIGDFVLLHRRFLKERKRHWGIVVSNQLPVGEMARRLLRLLTKLNQADIQNRLYDLQGFKTHP